MQLSEDRILVTHTGSLPRPPVLAAMLTRRFAGEAVDETEFAAQVGRAVRNAVAKQVQAGVDVGSNGEQGREGFFRYIKHRMTGFGGAWKRTGKADLDRYPEFRRMQERERQIIGGVYSALLPTAIGEVAYTDVGPIERELAEFRAALGEAGSPFVEAFMNAPSPGIVATAMQNRYYSSDATYIAALGRALRVEYQAIVGAGLLLQIDAPDLALEAHTAFRDRPRAEFLDFVACVVDTINDALVGIPPGRVRLHVCWGNSESPHDDDIPLAEILPLIAKARVGALVLPFAGPRHGHEFKLMSKLPDGMAIVAGIIDTTTNVIEHPELIADRLVRVAEAVGDPRRVLAGTDCGVETSAGSSRLASDVAWAKLASVAEGARIASRQLFGAETAHA